MLIRALFVDSNLNSRDALVARLATMPREWRADVVVEPDQALAAIRASHYDAVICDLDLRGTDGITLLGTLQRRAPKLVRILVAGDHDSPRMGDVLRVAHQMVRRPVDLDNLQTIIRDALFLQQRFQNNQLVKALGGITTIPAQTSFVHGLLDLLDAPDAELGAIARTIQKDAGMTTRVLQAGNSALFGARRAVDSVTAAVKAIGFDMVRALAISQLADGSFKPRNERERERFEKLQSMGVLTSLLSQRMGRTDGPRPHLVTAGILHTIGDIAVLCSEDLPGPVSSLDISTLGAYLLTLYGLPYRTVQLVACARHPLIAPAELRREAGELHLARVLALALTQQDFVLDRLNSEIDWVYFDAVRMTPEKLAEYYWQLSEQLNERDAA
jgi:DNA-binding response OmpR family regulator